MIDLTRYRKLALDLRKYRTEALLAEGAITCDNVHTNIALKHNHMYNRLAHLDLLDDLLSKQPDLFGF
ncbi:MAG: hypothetical protein H6577_09975 [Lewinellaceae bacterium]|nr:hypothetical protein [Saprospiraceae bacterium]MCB9338444.1 hypothetical protein [Lewinellaceae bacterium]